MDGSQNNNGGWVVGLVLLLVYGVLGIVRELQTEARTFYRQVRKKLGIAEDE